MNCGQARRLFGAYWDDEITQAEREWLESHFGSCEGCRTEYDAFARTLELVGELPRTEVEPGLAERSLARARRLAPVADRVPVTSPRWIPVTAAAALVAIAAATVLQWAGVAPPARVAARFDSAPVQQPVLITPPGTAAAPGSTGPIAARVTSPQAPAISDSLFDHNEDVEFVLDPVTLHRGRAHTLPRLTQPNVRGEAAVISF